VFLLTAIDLKKNAKVYQGQPQTGKPDCTLTLADEDMVQIVSTSNQTTESSGKWDCEVDGTGSGSCPMAGFGISGVEPSVSATRELVSW
jgi:hypothetical protein